MISLFLVAQSFKCVLCCVSGTKAWLLLLPGPLLPWCLAFHASGLLGRQLRPLSSGEVKISISRQTCSRDNQRLVYRY